MIPTTTLVLEIVLRSTLILTAVLLATCLLRHAAPVLTATVQNFAPAGTAAAPGPHPVRADAPLAGASGPRGGAAAGAETIAPGRRGRASAWGINRCGDASGGDRAHGPDPRQSGRASATPAARWFRVPSISGVSMVATVNATGCLVLLARIVLGFRRLRGLIAAASPIERGEWVDELQRRRAVVNLGRPVRLVASGTVNTPLTLPCRRPVIVYPGRAGTECHGRAAPRGRDGAFTERHHA